MSGYVDSFAYWLADYYLATTVLLVAALVAMRLMKQPAKRMAVTKSALLAMVVLAALCAMPGWSLVHLATSSTESERPIPMHVGALTMGQPLMLPAPTFVAPVQAASADPLVAADAAPQAALSWSKVLISGYALGSLGMLVWLASGVACARRLLRSAEPASAALEEILATVLAEVPQRPRLRVSKRIDVAAALGVWRPTILLPDSWINGCAVEELRVVVAHECAHVQNGDLRWLAFSRLVSVVLWLQPLYWLFRRRMRLDQEALADAAAAELSNRVTYAEQLVAWARAIPQRPRTALASAVGLWESPSQLRHRVALLVDEHFTVLRECSRHLRWASFLTCGLIALALSVVTFQPTHSDPQAESTATTDPPTNDLKVGEGADRVIIEDRFVVCPVTTDLQRSLLGDSADPSIDTSVCVFVNCAAYAQGDVDTRSAAFTALKSELVARAKQDKRQVRFLIIVAEVPGIPFSAMSELSNSLGKQCKKLGHDAGYVTATWENCFKYEEIDWPKYLEEADALTRHSAGNDEQCVGDDRIKVYSVQTFLSRLLVQADCVVNVLPMLRENNSADFPEALLSAMRKYLPQLEYERRKVIAIRVRSMPSAEANLARWGEDRSLRESVAARLGFARCSLNQSFADEAEDAKRTEDVTGRVVLPDGGPASGVSVMAYSMVDPENLSLPHDYQRGTTDEDGRFRLSIYSGGKEVFWILPRDYVQQTHVINDRRGDLGSFKLETGLYFHGRVVDENSKPISNVWVNAELVDGPAKQKIAMPVADMIERAALTDANGGFDLGPLPGGIYRVVPDEMPADDFRNLDESRRGLPAAFLPQRIELTAASELEEIELKPVDSVAIEVRFVDSIGKPARGNGFFLIGTMPDGRRVALRRGQQGDETVSFIAPKGLERTIIDFPRSSMRVRRSPSEPWENDFSLDLGTLDRDWREIEAVRYRNPVLVVTANDAAGNAIADFKPAIFYHYRDQQEPRKDRWIDDVRGDVDFEPRPNGSWQSEYLLPDEEFTLTVSADGYQTSEEKRSIKEGQFQQVKAVLKPLGSDSDTQGSTSTSGTESTKAETQHTVVGGGTLSVFVAGHPPTPWDYKPNVLAIAVEDEAGKPIEGVEAIVYRVSPQAGQREVVKRSTTNARGEVEFVGLVDAQRAAEFQERAAKSQFPLVQGDSFYTVMQRAGLTTVILPRSDFTIAGKGVKHGVRMRPAAALSGHVTDRAGKPVAGAIVAAGGIAGYFVVDGVNAVRTDADGRFTFTNLPAFNRAAAIKRTAEQNQWALHTNRDMSKMYPLVVDPAEGTSISDLVVKHPDYAVTTVRGGDVPGVTDIVMAPAAAIEGRLVEFGSGKPAVNVLVKAVGQVASGDSQAVYQPVGSPAPLFSGSMHTASTRTDGEGNYRLANLPAGTYEVWAQHPSNNWSEIDWVSTVIRNLTVGPASEPTKAANLVTGPGGTIRGQLIDAATGKPLAIESDAAVVGAMFHFVEGANQQQGQMQEVPVSKDGKFTMRAFPSRSRVFVQVKWKQGAGGTGGYRSDDDFHRTGQVFDLGHGESIAAEFRVSSNARIEALRVKSGLAYELLNKGDFDEAIAAFTELMEENPTNTSLLSGRAWAEERAGRDAEAVADYTSVVAAAPDDFGAMVRLADLLATSPDESVRDGRRAVELAHKMLSTVRDGSNGAEAEWGALVLFAAAQAEAGEFETAAATQRKVIELAPEKVREVMRERLKLYEAGKPYRREVPATGK